MNVNIRIAKIEDINGVVDSVLRHFKEPGFNNLPSHPYGKEHIFDRQEYYQRYLKRYSIPVNEVDWGRTFIIEYNGEIKAHLDIGNNSKFTLNQISLGMGLEMEIRGQKLGPKLLDYGLQWVRENTQAEEVTLFVFAHNTPAIKIYEKVGFKIVSETKNRFQIDGLNIDDLTMTLTIIR